MPPDRTGTRQWAALGVVLLAAFMGQVDLFVVNIAAPSIQTDLDASLGAVQWVIDAYVLCYAAGLVAGGRLGDRFGRKRLFLVGTLSFGALSLGCALAATAELLILARAGQGTAAALLMPQVLALIRATFDDERQRRRAIGWYGTVIGLGVIAGLSGGGLLLAWNPFDLGWRLVFLVNVPVAILTVVLSPTLPESRSDAPTTVDFPGAVLTALTLTALLAPLAVVREADPVGVMTGALGLGAGLVLLVVLIGQQRRRARHGSEPLWSPEVLGAPAMLPSLAVVACFFTGNAGSFLALTYHLQDHLGLDALVASLVFLPLGTGFAIASAIGHRVTWGVRRGSLMMVASLALVGAALFAPDAAQPLALALAVGIAGFGQGLVVSPLVSAVLARVPSRRAGAGSGVLNTVTEASMATGIAAGGLLHALGGLAGTLPLLIALALGVNLLHRSRAATDRYEPAWAGRRAPVPHGIDDAPVLRRAGD